MENQVKTTAPYASFPSFLNFFNKLHETGIPSRIDKTVFGNASGSIIYSVISSLKALNLIDDDGSPSDVFNSFVQADELQRKRLMRAILRQGYPSLFNGEIDLTVVTPGQFDDHLRNEYGAKGSTIDKAAAFFISAVKFADEPISAHLLKRQPIAPSSGSRKSNKQRKKVAAPTAVDSDPSEGLSRYHPFVQGLLDELPAANEFENWTIQEQAQWLQTAASIFRLLSKQHGEITVNATE